MQTFTIEEIVTTCRAIGDALTAANQDERLSALSAYFGRLSLASALRIEGRIHKAMEHEKHAEKALRRFQEHMESEPMKTPELEHGLVLKENPIERPKDTRIWAGRGYPSEHDALCSALSWILYDTELPGYVSEDWREDWRDVGVETIRGIVRDKMRNEGDCWHKAEILTLDDSDILKMLDKVHDEYDFFGPEWGDAPEDKRALLLRTGYLLKENPIERPSDTRTWGSTAYRSERVALREALAWLLYGTDYVPQDKSERYSLDENAVMDVRIHARDAVESGENCWHEAEILTLDDSDILEMLAELHADYDEANGTDGGAQ